MSGPRSLRPDAAVVARALAERIDELVGWLGLAPAAKTQNVFTPLNPTRGDRHPGSFVIYGRGHAKQGGWVEYAAPGAAGSRQANLAGDALDLCAYIRTGNARDRKTGFAVALQFLGWEGAEALDLPHQAEARLRLKRDRELAEKSEAAAIAQARRQAFERWTRDKKLTDDCPVWRYLGGRGIDLHKFVADGRSPGAIRQRDDDRHRESGSVLISMACLISSPEGKPWSVHRTFLSAARDGAVRKANVEPARKIWPGKYWGGAIRLAKGQNACSPEEAARNGLTDEVLAIGEGVETMLTVALVQPKWRCWAAGNVGAIGAVVAPKTVSMVVLVGENDEGPEALAAFERSVKAQAQQAKEKGFALYVIRPAAGDGDFNDTLQRLGEQIA